MNDKQRIGRFDPGIINNTIASMGGRAAQIKITPEERKRRGRKAARTLGREGRAARAKKGWETRNRREREGRDALLSAAPEIFQRVDEPPKRKPIKPGTNEAKVYEEMIMAKRRHGNAYPFAATTWAHDSGLTAKETSRALNSLRAGGHVVSEGGRIKMWRLAP